MPSVERCIGHTINFMRIGSTLRVEARLIMRAFNVAGRLERKGKELIFS